MVTLRFGAADSSHEKLRRHRDINDDDDDDDMSAVAPLRLNDAPTDLNMPTFIFYI